MKLEDIDDVSVKRLGAVCEVAWYLIVSAGVAIQNGQHNLDAAARSSIRENAAEVRKDIEAYLSTDDFQT